jgi:hypothetical protein
MLRSCFDGSALAWRQAGTCGRVHPIAYWCICRGRDPEMSLVMYRTMAAMLNRTLGTSALLWIVSTFAVTFEDSLSCVYLVEFVGIFEKVRIS